MAALYADDSYEAFADEPLPHTQVLRETLHEAYAGATEAELAGALGEMFDAMSAAEAFDFGQALNQMGRSATHVLSDPTVSAIAKTALPIAGGLVGTYFGGPLGAGLGSQFGTLAANALPPPRTSGSPAPRPPAPAAPGMSPPPAPPAPALSAPASAPAPAPAAVPPSAPPAPVPPAAAPAPAAVSPSAPAPSVIASVVTPAVPPAGVVPPPTTVLSLGTAGSPTTAGAPAMERPPAPLAPAVSGGSSAAAQALVLTQQPQILRSLLSAALGQHGRPDVGGIPVAQVLGLLSNVIGRAAEDADRLMYLGGDGADESVADVFPALDEQSLYQALLDADNLELAEAASAWDWS